MCCGGSADVLIEPMRPSLAVLVVGAGHVGLATARLLAESGFRVVLADARDAAAEQARIENVRAAGVRVLTTDHDDPGVLAALCARPEEAALLVMTHDHQLDQAVVEWAIARRFSYVGGVGSRAKAERTKKRLEAKGVPQTDVARLRMPVGVDIGARRPVEIAIAIVAELIAFRSRREGAARRGHPEHARIDEVSDPSQSEVPSDGAEDERDSDAAE
jgi:xanthine dehydrogenase accessory factor